MNSNNELFSIYTGPESEERVSSSRRSLDLQQDALKLQEDSTVCSGDSKELNGDDQTKSSKTEDGVYYFGTGPIVNPLVRKRRGVQVSEERAAILSEYRTTFAVGGIANIVQGNGCEVHGVLMKFDSNESWEEYKKMNAGNDQVRPVDVYPYNAPDTPIRSYVFVMEGKDIAKDAPMEQPAEERYLKLISDGLRFHGVDDEYIDYTIMSNEYVPSRKPGDYYKFPCKSKIVPIAFEKYEVLCKNAKDKYYFVIDKDVFEMPVSNPENPGAGWIRGQCHGKGDMSWTIYKIRIDPDIPEVESEEDLTPLHYEWVQSMTYENSVQVQSGGDQMLSACGRQQWCGSGRCQWRRTRRRNLGLTLLPRIGSSSCAKERVNKAVHQ